MFETVLIPHGNQIKIIRGVQDSVCELSDGFVPFEPFFMRFDCEPPLDVAESVVAKGVQLCGRNVFLLSDVLAGGERFSGRILLGFFLGEGGFPFGADFPECSFVFPVFKIAKVSFCEESSDSFSAGFGIKWKIMSEKWKKILRANGAGGLDF